jgi:hypothetical protein
LKPRSPVGVSGIVVLVLALVGLAFLGLRPGRTEVRSDQGPVITPPDSGAAVVAFLRESGGFSLLGLRFTDSTHYVEVKFITGPGCSGLVSSGDPWPTSFPECSSPVALVGEVGGTGVTMSGDSLVGVQFEVPRACFELLAPGMAWPPDLPECHFGS